MAIINFTPKSSCNFSQHHSFFPASIPLPLSRNDSAEIVNQKRLLRALEQLTNRLKRTLAKQPFSTFHVSSEMIVAEPKSLESKKATLYCRPGSVLKGRVCGEFQNEVNTHSPGHIWCRFSSEKCDQHFWVWVKCCKRLESICGKLFRLLQICHKLATSLPQKLLWKVPANSTWSNCEFLISALVLTHSAVPCRDIFLPGVCGVWKLLERLLSGWGGTDGV